MSLLYLRFCKWIPIILRVKPKLCHRLHGFKNMVLFYFFKLSYTSFVILQWHQSSLSPLSTLSSFLPQELCTCYFLSLTYYLK